MPCQKPLTRTVTREGGEKRTIIKSTRLALKLNGSIANMYTSFHSARPTKLAKANFTNVSKNKLKKQKQKPNGINKVKKERKKGKVTNKYI